jgi:hypothetical protein
MKGGKKYDTEGSIKKLKKQVADLEEVLQSGGSSAA